MLEQLLSILFEANQNIIDTLESEDCDAEDYLPETVLSMNKLDSSSNNVDGDIDASVGGGRAPEDQDQDQEIHTASSAMNFYRNTLVFG